MRQVIDGAFDPQSFCAEVFVVLFGEKFYPLLNKMPAWRHSLFALVLATRQYPNFALWCEVKEVQGKTQYLNALKACWHFHYDKFNLVVVKVPAGL